MNHRIKRIASSAFAICATGIIYSQSAWAALPIEHWTQASGAQIYLVQSPAVALVDMEIDFDAGSRRDPAAKAGLAGVTASMTGKGVRAHGNQPALNENGLNDAWADLGANFGSGASADRMMFTLRSLSDPAILLPAVKLAARQIGEPTYPADVWDQERQRSIAGLREADTRPGTLAGKTYIKAVYGGHPYGQFPTEASLKAITVSDMQALHDRALRSCAAKVSIVGDVDHARADELATVVLSRLPSGNCVAQPAVDAVPPLAHAEDIRLPFPGAAQAHIYIGQPGVPRSDPAYFPLLVGNHILGGGGFVSRLTEQVREKRGLSYSIYSGFNPGLEAGAFTIALETRPDQAAEAVKVAHSVLDGFVAEGPTAAELKAAQANLIGGFPLRIDSDAKLIGNVANIAWNGLPLDYLDTWTSHVRDVTLQDIRTAFTRVLQPDRMVTVVVGAKP
jgi:zinc protease